MAHLTIYKTDDLYGFIMVNDNVEIGSASLMDKKTLLSELSDNLDKLGDVD